MSITQLGYLGIGVKEVDRWEDYATGILGLTISDRLADGTIYLRMDEYHHRFILHPDSSDDLLYIGWQMPTEGALKELQARLRDAGVATQPGTTEERAERRVMDLIKFDDPDGCRHEAFHGPLALADSSFQPSRPIKGFVTGNMGLGHIVLNVGDLDQMTSFYRDVMGLRISDFVEINRGGRDLRMSFFHCNPRHHSLALVGRPGPPRISHFMIEVVSLDDVGATYYLCQEQDVPIATTLGRHSNDHMVSFYMLSPSGFRVEYGCEGRIVDDATWTIQHYKTGSIWGHKPAAPLDRPGGQAEAAAGAARG